jgi:membrane-bound serine protease (ClpP class)
MASRYTLNTRPIHLIRKIRRHVLRLLAVVAVVLALLMPVAQPILVRAQESTGGDVYVGQIDGTITPVMARYVERAIERAEKANAAAIVFEMDTPGGLSSAMDDITRDIIESEVPVVVYVTPRGARAASAGVYIGYAAHIFAMAPGTNVGSASPIFSDGSGDTDGNETLRAKVTNDAVSQIVNFANLRGRNAEWAEKAVREAANITADEALSLGVIDLIAPDLSTLLSDIDGQTVQMENGQETLVTNGAATRSVDMDLLESLLQLLADPTIAYMLLSLGLLGIYVEFSNPGLTLPGVAGGIAILIALFSLGTLPVNWAGVLLILLAFILFAVDLYVPSFGVITIGGIISFILGSYLLVGSDAPPGYNVAPAVIWTLSACFLALSLFLGGAVLRARLRPPATGKNALLGRIGTVRTALQPTGMVFADGELWTADLESQDAEPLPVGTKVVIVAVKRLQLVVRAATEDEVAKVDREERSQQVGDAREVVPYGSFPAPDRQTINP